MIFLLRFPFLLAHQGCHTGRQLGAAGRAQAGHAPCLAADDGIRIGQGALQRGAQG